MVYVFLADGFEEIEALTPMDVLRRAGLDVRTVGVGSKRVTGSHRVEVIADIEEKEMEFDSLQAVVLPGGLPGAVNLDRSRSVQKAVARCFEGGGYVAAICAAPSVLGHMGLLKGKRATCSPGFEKELLGAEFCDESVVADGKIITGNGPGAAMPFALKLAEVLSGEETARRLRKSMQCR
jgi:4-methyl-5(b-hydroxyethyl)-thiazole monophosphate biosynthesis